MSKLDLIREDVAEHGEVHVVIPDVGERDVRQGNTEFDADIGVMTVEDGTAVHRIDVSEIAYWYRPKEF